MRESRQTIRRNAGGFTEYSRFYGEKGGGACTALLQPPPRWRDLIGRDEKYDSARKSRRAPLTSMFPRRCFWLRDEFVFRATKRRDWSVKEENETAVKRARGNTHGRVHSCVFIGIFNLMRWHGHQCEWTLIINSLSCAVGRPRNCCSNLFILE